MISAAIARVLLDHGPLPSDELRARVLLDLKRPVTYADLGSTLLAMRREGYVRMERGPKGTHVPTVLCRELARL